MTARILDGKALAETIKAELRSRVSALAERGVRVVAQVVLDGGDVHDERGALDGLSRSAVHSTRVQPAASAASRSFAMNAEATPRRRPASRMYSSFR